MADMTGLRAWQQEAMEGFLEAGQRDWLTAATPGAGKTTYSLRIARHMLDRGFVERIIVVCPTDHLRTQWVEAAARVGIDLRSTPNSARIPADAHGCVVTYAQVALNPAAHRLRCQVSTFVIFDEVHHTGEDKSWGSGVVEAFQDALVRFSITGTPFRSDDSRIAHVDYQMAADGLMQSAADYTYGYAEALRDGVVRPVRFAVYSGRASWSDNAGKVQEVLLGDPALTRAAEDSAWRTVLDPDGEWIAHVMSAAWDKVLRLRAATIPDAAVLIPASSQEQARAYAQVWEQITGNKALVALSDDPEAAEVIREFRDNPDHLCLVCVRLVTEGVDIPRCAVLVWATTASTPLFFAQMVGRVVRARNRREQATVFLPAVTSLLGLAHTLEQERDHVIALPVADEGLLDDPEAVADDDTGAEADAVLDDEPTWKALDSEAAFQQLVASDQRLPAAADNSDDAAELFGLEGLLTPEQEAAILAREDEERRRKVAEMRRSQAMAQDAEAARHRQAIVDAQRRGVPIPADTRDTLEQTRRNLADMQHGGDMSPAELRRRIATSVARRAGQVRQEPAKVWGQLYQAVAGPKNQEATVELLRRRYRYVNTKW